MNKNILLSIVKTLEKAIIQAEKSGETDVFNRLCEAVNIIICKADGVRQIEKKHTLNPVKKAEIKPEMSALERYQARYGK